MDTLIMDAYRYYYETYGGSVYSHLWDDIVSDSYRLTWECEEHRMSWCIGEFNDAIYLGVRVVIEH